MKDDMDGRNQVEALRRMLAGNLIWPAIAFLLVALVLFSSIRIGRVSGEQVGIMLNKINGKVTVIGQSGVRVYNGITNDFYVLDRTLQTLEMTEVVGQGDRSGRDDLKIKTTDGSDVFVDLKVQYKIDPEMADVVITTSGLGDQYKVKWARDYIRSLSRNYLGELTTEKFYDSSQRDVKILLALEQAKKRLSPFGIDIDSIVIPRKPHFYQEYEDMIKNKKLADQAVLEEQSKALAAKQKQLTLIVEETNKKNVAVEQFEGQMKQKVISANAEGERIRKQADAYYDQVTIGAGAGLYQQQKEAEAILAKKKAEAEGIEMMKKALEGEGGRNMVKMEYARKLGTMKITGRPFSISGSIERFEHLQGAETIGRQGTKK